MNRLPQLDPFQPGERVRITDGTFAGMQGTVVEFRQRSALVRVEVVLFGRPVPVELEPWQEPI